MSGQEEAGNSTGRKESGRGRRPGPGREFCAEWAERSSTQRPAGGLGAAQVETWRQWCLRSGAGSGVGWAAAGQSEWRAGRARKRQELQTQTGQRQRGHAEESRDLSVWSVLSLRQKTRGLGVLDRNS